MGLSHQGCFKLWLRQLQSTPCLLAVGIRRGQHGVETVSPLGHGTGQATPLPLHTFHTPQRPCITRVLALECQSTSLSIATCPRKNSLVREKFAIPIHQETRWYTCLKNSKCSISPGETKGSLLKRLLDCASWEKGLYYLSPSTTAPLHHWCQVHRQLTTCMLVKRMRRWTDGQAISSLAFWAPHASQFRAKRPKGSGAVRGRQGALSGCPSGEEEQQ